MIWGRAGRSHTRNLEIRRNILYDLRSRLAGIIVTGSLKLDNVRIEGNQVQFPGLTTPLVHLAPGVLGVRFAGNAYSGGRPEREWFAVGAPDQDHREWINVSAYDRWLPHEVARLSLAQWKRRTREADAREERIAYVGPGRTIETYMKHLGLTPTQKAFFAEVRRQSKANWRPEFTARAVNDYIRAGFAVKRPKGESACGLGRSRFGTIVVGACSLALVPAFAQGYGAIPATGRGNKAPGEASRIAGHVNPLAVPACTCDPDPPENAPRGGGGRPSCMSTSTAERALMQCPGRTPGP